MYLPFLPEMHDQENVKYPGALSRLILRYAVEGKPNSLFTLYDFPLSAILPP